MDSYSTVHNCYNELEHDHEPATKTQITIPNSITVKTVELLNCIRQHTSAGDSYFSFISYSRGDLMVLKARGTS